MANNNQLTRDEILEAIRLLKLKPQSAKIKMKIQKLQQQL
jgi:hypothetical protein